MLSTIRFDDQFSLEAGKVDNVASDRRLPAKAAIFDLPVTQDRPETLFRISQIATEFSSQLFRHA